MRDEIRRALQRALYREFLLEEGLHQEAGLDNLPTKLAELLGCEADEAIATLVQSPDLHGLPLERLDKLLHITDMALVSRTAASVTQELRGRQASYDDCIRRALCHAVAGQFGHMFSALRVAAAHNDQWARHHYLYGLALAIQGNLGRATWELKRAIKAEPFEEGRARVVRVKKLVGVLQQCQGTSRRP